MSYGCRKIPVPVLVLVFLLLFGGCGRDEIVELAPDYSSAIVTSSTKNSLWILSRTPRLSKETLEKYLAQIREWGFDVSALEYPKQK